MSRKAVPSSVAPSEDPDPAALLDDEQPVVAGRADREHRVGDVGHLVERDRAAVRSRGRPRGPSHRGASPMCATAGPAARVAVRSIAADGGRGQAGAATAAGRDGESGHRSSPAGWRLAAAPGGHGAGSRCVLSTRPDGPAPYPRAMTETRHADLGRAEHDRAAARGPREGARARVRSRVRRPGGRVPAARRPRGGPARARGPGRRCSTRLGVTVHELGAETDDPDLVYVFDPLLIADGGAIPLRPGKPGPGGGARRPRGMDPRPGHPDARPDRGAGHDRGRGHLLAAARPAGHRPVAADQRRGARQLAAIVGGDVRIVDLPYWRGPAELVHLLSVISPVADDVAVVFLPLLPDGALRAAARSSACGWSRCPRRSTHPRLQRAGGPARRGGRRRGQPGDPAPARGGGRARSTPSRWARSARTGRAA